MDSPRTIVSANGHLSISRRARATSAAETYAELFGTGLVGEDEVYVVPHLDPDRPPRAAGLLQQALQPPPAHSFGVHLHRDRRVGPTCRALGIIGAARVHEVARHRPSGLILTAEVLSGRKLL